MKRLPFFLFFAFVAAVVFQACNVDSNDDSETYAEWKQTNQDWLNEQLAKTNDDGTPYYKKLVPAWNPAAFVLIHYFNDRALTEGNLSPLYTSTIDTRYYVQYCEGTPMDSSYTLTANGPAIFRTQLSSTIEGWAIAFSDMRVGDTAVVIVPYQQAYGTTSSSVLPYSNLQFNVSLVDIVDYEKNPK